MRMKMMQLIAMVAMVMSLTLGPALVSRAASLSSDGGCAVPTALVGGRSSGY